MLGMYVHTHWAYRRPYAARSWTFEDWRGYLRALSHLGYDLLMVWPLLDCMPVEPTVSDRQFLRKVHDAIDYAHDALGMMVLITSAPNTIGNDRAASYCFEDRPYFPCEHKTNPKDTEEVRRFLDGRAKQLALIGNADGLAIIDSDPGGYAGSTDDEFVALAEQQLAVFRQYNPQAHLYYWMLFGWEPYNRFWDQMRRARSEGRTQAPHLSIENARPEDFEPVLQMLTDRIADPWGVLCGFPPHHTITERLKMTARRLYFPYGVIEAEPTFPLTNVYVREIEKALAPYSVRSFPRGIMGNAQTHCLQIPNTYLFAREATRLGAGISARLPADLIGLAEKLVPEAGADIADAWLTLRPEAGAPSSSVHRKAADRVRRHIGSGKDEHELDDLSGLLFGDPDRFLSDLIANLEIRATLADLSRVVQKETAGQAAFGTQTRRALRELTDVLRPYRDRLGFTDAYGGPFADLLHPCLRRLRDAHITEVLDQFQNWTDPTVRNGLAVRLIEAVEEKS